MAPFGTRHARRKRHFPPFLGSSPNTPVVAVAEPEKKNWKRKGLLRKSDFPNTPELWLKASSARRLRG